MRQRPSARLLIVDEGGRLLLFRFEHRGAASQVFWATPGGALDPGESYEAAARRELLEETGLAIADPGPQVARRQAAFDMPDGERVEADERFFLIRVSGLELSREGWTALERAVMTDHRWWTEAELRRSHEQIWPENLADMLAGLLPRGL